MGDPVEGGDGGEGEQGVVVEKPRRKLVDAAGLLLFGLIAMVGLGTYVMVIRAGVQTGTASAATAITDGQITTFLSGGVQNLRQMMSMLHDTGKVVAQFNSSSSARQVPLDNLKTNPFRATEVVNQPVVPLSDDAAKRQAELDRQSAQAIANNLRLDSIVYGSHSGCMINGKSYVEGQSSDTFVVDRILPTSVWVRIGEIRWQLKMAPPAGFH